MQFAPISRLACLCVVIAACATSRFDRAWVSTDVQARTGHAIAAAQRPPARPTIPSGVSLADGLGQDEAVAIALWNNPTFVAELERLATARADLTEAGQLPNPTLALLVPTAVKQLEFTLFWALDFLWSRPSRVSAARLEVERVAASLVQVALDLTRDTKLSYLDAVLAHSRSRIRLEIRQAWAELAAIAMSRFRSGEIAEAEASAVHADSRAAFAEAERMPREAAVAIERLRNVLGIGLDSPSFELAAELAPPPDPLPVEALLDVAMHRRPDLRSAQLGVEAAGSRAGWERARVYSFIGMFDANMPTHLPASGLPNEFGPGFQATIPVFNQNQGGVARAEADVRRLAWRYAALRQQVALEVQQARLQFEQARDAERAFRVDVVPPLADNVRSATSAFSHGNDSYLVVLDATRRLQDAQLRHAELAADLHRAAAQVERSIGGRAAAAR